MGRLDGKCIIVTGAAQGIGAVYAKAIAAEGASVIVSDIIDASQVVLQINERGGRAISVPCDVARAASVESMVRAAETAFGSVHGLVNNAALFAALPKKPIEDITSDEFDKVMAVNVRGSFECLKAVLPIMKRQQYGKIVNIASGTVFKGSPNLLSYVASKGAVVAMTRAAAREVGRHGVRVNCIAPGLTMSEGVVNSEDYKDRGRSTVESRCLQREQLPEDLTGALIYLLSTESDFVTGQTIVVDGGAVMH